VERFHGDGAGVVEQNIVGPESLGDPVECRGHLPGVGYIGFEEFRGAAVLPDQAHDLFTRFLLDVENGDGSALIGEGQRGGAPHSGAAAGDDSGLSGQSASPGSRSFGVRFVVVGHVLVLPSVFV
jgi:hypothetical protein